MNWVPELYLNKAILKRKNFDLEPLMLTFFTGLLFFNISHSAYNVLLSGQ